MSSSPLFASQPRHQALGIAVLRIVTGITFAAHGYQKLFTQLEKWLADITGFSAVSLQPNAGSQGEYAGLLAIHGYHAANALAVQSAAGLPARDTPRTCSP